MITKDELEQSKKLAEKSLSTPEEYFRQTVAYYSKDEAEFVYGHSPEMILKMHEMIESQSEQVKILEEALEDYSKRDGYYDDPLTASEALQKLAELRGGK